jgi:hypothetical protein
MPLPHKEFTTFDGPVWYLDDGLCVDTIYDEDFGAFHRDELEEFYRASINIRTTCIYIANAEVVVDFKSYAKNIAVPLQFVFNSFAADKPIAIPYAAIIDFDKKAHIREIVDIEAIANLHALQQQSYRMRPDTEPATVSEYYKVVRKCCTDYPPLTFALDRFSSSLGGGNLFDRIVDITISLESLISGSQDLKFKFALLNSLI